MTTVDTVPRRTHRHHSWTRETWDLCEREAHSEHISQRQARPEGWTGQIRSRTVSVVSTMMRSLDSTYLRNMRRRLVQRCAHKRTAEFDTSSNDGPPTTQHRSQSVSLVSLLGQSERVLDFSHELGARAKILELCPHQHPRVHLAARHIDRWNISARRDVVAQ
jgi:hypothetical protein